MSGYTQSNSNTQISSQASPGSELNPTDTNTTPNNGAEL
jgi:hypothetical protein